MRVLIGCEESQTVCVAFRRLDIEAYSCDLKPGWRRPEWHIQGDVIDVIASRRWSLIILHPDCTYLAVSGNRYYAGTKERDKAIEWTLNLWELAKQYSHRVALENPCSVIFPYLPNVQYIQPWQFGHGEVKKTGFALHNLPKLKPTSIVGEREPKIHYMAPGLDRKRNRSRTYPGIAEAIADQWGSKKNLTQALWL